MAIAFEPNADELYVILQRQAVTLANQMTHGTEGKVLHPKDIEAYIVRMYNAVAALNEQLTRHDPVSAGDTVALDGAD